MIYNKKRVINILIFISISALVFSGIGCQGTDEPAEKPDNSEIESAIERDFLSGLHGDMDKIDISVEEGIVTLRGSVNTLLTKREAEQITESIKGVRAIVNQITVNPPEVDDETLKENVEWAFTTDPVVESYEIDVRVNDGQVTLEGIVESFAEQRFAERVTERVRGVKSIENNIEIQTTSKRLDEEIEREIEKKVTQSVWYDGDHIGVDVENGIVDLTGVVGSLREKRLIESDAWVSGVVDVSAGELDVRWWARDPSKREKRISMSDAKIKAAVKDALLYDPRVLSTNVTVTAKNGIVTLDGMVKNLSARDAAIQDAENTLGVILVEDDLDIKPLDPLRDDVITQRIKRSFKMDPYVEEYELNVLTVDGKVHLAGRVDTKYEKATAGIIASRQAGVIDVDNDIEVQEAWTAKTDGEIKNDVERELQWSLLVDSDDIEVDVSDGFVTLSGTVHNKYSALAAIKNAYEGGALSVTNNLNIEYGGSYMEKPEWPGYPGYYFNY